MGWGGGAVQNKIIGQRGDKDPENWAFKKDLNFPKV